MFACAHAAPALAWPAGRREGAERPAPLSLENPIQIGRSKGKITLEFASVDDLERIVAAMAPHAISDGEPLDDGVPG